MKDIEKEHLREVADQEISYNNKLMDKIQHLEAKLKSQESIIQAADEVIKSSYSFIYKTTHSVKFNDALIKYKLLKEKNNGKI